MDECKPLPGGCHGIHVQGRAVQVDPMKLNSKPPGTEHLKLKCGSPLSNFAFNNNLRRYPKAFESPNGDVRSTAVKVTLECCALAGRGLYSSTFRLNFSATCGIGGAFRGGLGVV